MSMVQNIILANEYTLRGILNDCVLFTPDSAEKSPVLWNDSCNLSYGRYVLCAVLFERFFKLNRLFYNIEKVNLKSAFLFVNRKMSIQSSHIL